MRLHQVALDGTPPRELLREFLREGTWFWIAPHPDGRISAWGHHRHRGQGFYTVDPGGKTVTVSRIAPGLPVAPIALGPTGGASSGIRQGPRCLYRRRSPTCTTCGRFT
jgi:hypothetical protein